MTASCLLLTGIATLVTFQNRSFGPGEDKLVFLPQFITNTVHHKAVI
jgi:hypothetical protein